jgi:hypothetical protein
LDSEKSEAMLPLDRDNLRDFLLALSFVLAFSTLWTLL